SRRRRPRNARHASRRRSRRCATRWAWHISVSTRRRSEEHTSELQSRFDLVCRLLLEKKKKHQSSDTGLAYGLVRMERLRPRCRATFSCAVRACDTEKEGASGES